MSYLIDVNVLIARSDQRHQYHAAAFQWFASIGDQPFFTCPIVENGFVRIFGNPNYPGGPGNVEAACQILRLIRSMPGHCFLPDGLSIADRSHFPDLGNANVKALTDVYLLGLAVDMGLKFATFDSKIKAQTVKGGAPALEVIQTPEPKQ